MKNRSTQEIKEGITIDGRHRKEREFFSTTAPWTELPKDRVGIYALKRFLGELLYEHIKSEFPNVTKDIEGSLAVTEKDLELLGPSRQTAIDQRRFLTRTANLYQRGVDDALSGNYDVSLLADSALKLRMHVRELGDGFSKALAKSGHSKVFRTPSGELDAEYTRFGKENRKSKVHCDSEEDITNWIRRAYRDSRGTELPGTVNPRVLERLFRQQSSPWSGIALIYIGRVSEAVKTFNQDILGAIVRDKDVRERLLSRLERIQDATNVKAKKAFEEMLNDERGGILQTVNHYYAETLNAIRDERVRARLQGMGFGDTGYATVNLTQVMQGIHLSNEDQAVNDIHDILKAYYKVALKRFADNVVIQIVERHILGRDGPVRVLCSDMVNDLDDTELLEIAGEKFLTSSMRNELTAKRERFLSALEIAKEAGI